MLSVSEVCLLLASLTITTASMGDRSFVYQRCLSACDKKECQRSTEINNQPLETTANFKFYQLTLPERAIKWDCPSECRYHCMWWTVDAFLEDKSNIPQFYGKWPQMRVFGIEEPASALFSLLNFFTQLHVVISFHRGVSFRAPMYLAWIFFFLVGTNAWIWSTVFHTYNVDFTEKMDYCSGFAYTLCFLFVLLLRVSHRAPTWTRFIYALLFAIFFIEHAQSLAYGPIKYDYNMKVCVIIGMLTVIGWLYFPFCLFTRRQRSNARYVQLAVSLIALSSVFELLDFPAIFWLFDSHAIWHAATVGVPYLIIRFAKVDCQYLMETDV